MNANAANALLKGLEEPPVGAMFILVAHRPARLLATIRSRCVAVPVPVPSHEAGLKWLTDQGVKDAARWLAYAGGAPLQALGYSSSAEALDRLLGAIRGRTQILIDDREELETLAEALQKVALDQALAIQNKLQRRVRAAESQLPQRPVVFPSGTLQVLSQAARRRQ
jgi:DNA polymerase-3 subunit delta'